MSSTAAKPKPVRRAVDAVLIPVQRLAEWYAHASAMPGLNDVERGVLAAIAEWYCRLRVMDYAGSLSYPRMAQRIGADPVPIRWAVDHLVELGLIAVQPGAGGRANTYPPCLPRRIAASMLTAAAVEGGVMTAIGRGFIATLSTNQRGPFSTHKAKTREEAFARARLLLDQAEHRDCNTDTNDLTPDSSRQTILDVSR